MAALPAGSQCWMWLRNGALSQPFFNLQNLPKSGGLIAREFITFAREQYRMAESVDVGMRDAER